MSQQSDSPYKDGDRVRHPVLGLGTVKGPRPILGKDAAVRVLWDATNQIGAPQLDDLTVAAQTGNEARDA